MRHACDHFSYPFIHPSSFQLFRSAYWSLQPFTSLPSTQPPPPPPPPDTDMSGLRKRTTIISTPEEKPTPLSTSKFKDRQSGLTYNYEDRFSKMKAFKTFLLMTFLTLSIFYILYELYKVIWNVIVDIYVYDIKHTGNFSHPHFRRNVWIAEIKDLLVISIKGIGLYAVFRMLNSRLLLKYDDEKELDEFN